MSATARLTSRKLKGVLEHKGDKGASIKSGSQHQIVLSLF